MRISVQKGFLLRLYRELGGSWSMSYYTKWYLRKKSGQKYSKQRTEINAETLELSPFVSGSPICSRFNSLLLSNPRLKSSNISAQWCSYGDVTGCDILINCGYLEGIKNNCVLWRISYDVVTLSNKERKGELNMKKLTHSDRFFNTGFYKCHFINMS